MIDVKQAAEIAAQYFFRLNPQVNKNITLEEVEISDDERYWYITLGYTEPGTDVWGRGEKQYKIITVDTAEGTVRSMKIRKI